MSLTPKGAKITRKLLGNYIEQQRSTISTAYIPLEHKHFSTRTGRRFDKICEYLQTSKDKLEKATFEVFDTKEGKRENDPHHSISRASARFAEMAIAKQRGPRLSAVSEALELTVRSAK